MRHRRPRRARTSTRPTLGLVIAVVFVLFGLTGCQRGPNDDVLRDGLQSELDTAFDAGLFEITSFRRMGSASFTGDGDAASGVHIYYDAVLELQRDHALTSWKGLNLGTLAFVVGATDAGVSGLRARGNEAGDELAVHGRLSYMQVGDDWHRIDAVGAEAAEPLPEKADALGAGPRRLLEGLRSPLFDSAKPTIGSHDAVIVDELKRAVARIDLRLAHLDGKLTLGTGGTPGTYHRFGLALRDFASREGFPIHSYESEGSLENGALLRNGELDFALLQSDVAETLHLGRPESGVLANRRMRSVASLWPEAVHLVTLEANGVTKLDDLRRRRVGVGLRGSGTRFNVIAIATASNATDGLELDIVDLDVQQGIRALESGEIAALFVTSAVPSRPLQALASRRPDVRFVSIDAAVVHQLAEHHFAYYALDVDARTYPNQTEPFRTVGLASTLVTHDRVDGESVERVLDLLVGQADNLSGSYFRAGFITPDTMRLGIAVPLHPAAERFYERVDAAAAATAGDEPTTRIDASAGSPGEG